ncbi:MAG: response regulator [Bdellovibrionales bacterium]|nr:response regulator [Bdellovibrionales bacterium]MBT3525309.1 response regulator [Bdellovibrionales bacterium]MBT7668544.1 response regulator [Bdellovibrionales bacterium]MBT7766149.1 response regulator [Bdellovibrionales bacterium]
MLVTIYGKNGEKYGEFPAPAPIRIGRIIDNIPSKDIPFKSDIDISKTLEELKTKFQVNAESILMLDDDEEFLTSSKFWLQKLGHYVEAYSNADQAFMQISNYPNRYHRILIDQNMPGINGASFAQSIEALSHNFKIYILTANVESVPSSFTQKYPVVKKPCNMINIVGAASKNHISRERTTNY